MMDLTGYMTINGTDIWAEYGVFLGETEAGGHVNMDALLRVPKAKEITKVDFRERTGVELPDNPNVKLSSIERTLQFWLRSNNKYNRLQKYQEFMSLITSGMLTISIKDYRTYKMVYQDMPIEPDWYVSYEGDRFYAFFQVKFLEPQPSI